MNRHIVTDASDTAESSAAINTLESVDLVVHKAGSLDRTYVHKQKVEQWQAIISINLDSCFVVTVAVLP
ncbi:SDR family NAD(P)-dependent oxidoreductase [Mycobacterium lepromatosis]|uniref:SDR family NAD(P)-dependent oxidoreductase n=1 Tax=Mycobacterium lepromatosis TaxID=480418 RepID=UPI003B509624